LIVKCTVQRRVEGSDIAQTLRLAQASVGQNGLLALLSDTHPVIVKRFVNVNNFLAEMGVIERDEQNGQVDWRGSLAYHAGHGQLWVNLLGRDAQGAVHPQGEYEEVRETLVKALPAKLRDAGTGEPVIERVYRKEELYAGEYLFCAPDLVIVFKPGYAPSPKSTHIEFDDATFTTPAAGMAVMAGVHPSALRGFLLASAPVLLRGVVAPERAPLTAVTPTLLHAAGVEYVDVDSPAVSALFSPAYLESHPIRSVSHNQELSEEDEELIISHLRDLGYV
jgi:predicted AlkP superfamily phosphohydrolase/phosphomutase